MFAALIDIDVFLESVPTVLADVVCYLKYFNFFYNATKVFIIIKIIINKTKTISVKNIYLKNLKKS